MATVPGAPTIAIGSPDDGKYVLSFTVPADGGSPITDYEYQVNSEPIVSIGIYRNPFVVTGLTNGVTYDVKLRAVNAEGAGPWSAPSFITPDATVYYTITRLATSGANADIARIAFSSVNMPGPIEDPEAVSLRTADNYPQAGIGATSVIGVDPWTYDVSGLLDANGLRWVVGTFTVTGYGSFPVARQVVAASPTTPRNVVVTPGNAQLTVSWIPPLSDGGSPITSYNAKLYIGATLINTYTNVTSPTVIPSLANGTTYNVQVVANNAVGATSSASVPGTPFAPSIPTAPTIDSATAGNGTITIAYTAPTIGAPITSYQYSLDGGMNVVSAGLTNPFQITGLSNGQLYTIILRAVNVAGAGAWSSPAYAMPTSGQKMFALGDRFVRVVFDSTKPAPVHVSSTGEKDILNPRSWNVLQTYSDRSGGRVLTGLSVKQLDNWTYELLVLQPFLREGSEYKDVDYGAVHVSGTGQVSLDIAFEDSSTEIINQGFSISIASVNASNTAQAVSRGYALKDIANVSISPLSSALGGDYYEFLGGTLLINSAGDYASMSGEALLRKLIMRRLISRKGDFFHLPDYGANLEIKGVFSTANLPTMAKDIERQVQQEPDVEKAKVTLTYQSANSILVVQVQARMRSTGQQVGLSMSLPLGGVKSF